MRPYHAHTPDQAFLLPPALTDLIAADDPVQFVRQAVAGLDLGAIHRAYECARGRPPFHPEAMTGLLLYGACRSIYSSRKLARACGENVAFMYRVSMDPPASHT